MVREFYKDEDKVEVKRKSNKKEISLIEQRKNMKRVLIWEEDDK